MLYANRFGEELPPTHGLIKQEPPLQAINENEGIRGGLAVMQTIERLEEPVTGDCTSTSDRYTQNCSY